MLTFTALVNDNIIITKLYALELKVPLYTHL